MHTFSGWKERFAAFKIVCTLRLRPGKPYANLFYKSQFVANMSHELRTPLAASNRECETTALCG
jgi:hypothetical protein